jgi:hypothetical protein
MTRSMRLLLVALVAVLAAMPGPPRRPRPTFGVTFEPGAEYLRVGKGTSDGMVGDYLGPRRHAGCCSTLAMAARSGRSNRPRRRLREHRPRHVATPGARTLADVDHLSVPGIEGWNS